MKEPGFTTKRFSRKRPTMRDVGATRLYIATTGQWQCLKVYLRCKSYTERRCAALWWGRGIKVVECLAVGYPLHITSFDRYKRQYRQMRKKSLNGFKRRFGHLSYGYRNTDTPPRC